MARTFDQVLAAITADMPSPSIDWYLHDDAPHSHDDASLARCEMTFDGESFIYEAHINGAGANYGMKLRRVHDEEAARATVASTRFTSWATLTAQLALDFEGNCERIRTDIASEVYAREVLADAGLTLEPIRLLSLTSSVAGKLTRADGGYAYSTAVGYDTLTVEADDGATVTWAFGEVETTGESYVVALAVGENVVTITITADNRLTTTHVVTITKTA